MFRCINSHCRKFRHWFVHQSVSTMSSVCLQIRLKLIFVMAVDLFRFLHLVPTLDQVPSMSDWFHGNCAKDKYVNDCTNNNHVSRTSLAFYLAAKKLRVNCVLGTELFRLTSHLDTTVFLPLNVGNAPVITPAEDNSRHFPVWIRTQSGIWKWNLSLPPSCLSS